MLTITQRKSSLTRVRVVLGLALTLAAVSGLVRGTTLAAYITTTKSPDNLFIVGTVDIGGLVAGSTPSNLPSANVFKWAAGATGGPGTGCSNVLPGANKTLSGMTPGSYCVAQVTIRNDHPDSLEAWVRLRLVRSTPAGSAATEAMNNRLRFYMSEYTAGTARTVANYQAADCKIGGTFVPDVPASTANIADIRDAVNGSRIALSSLGVTGKNLGIHPGLSAPTDPLVNALGGMGLGIGSGTNAVPTDANTITTAGATRNAFNLFGNDEVTNPKLISNSNTDNGTNTNGTIPESILGRQTTRYYCAAIFFPNDTDLKALPVIYNLTPAQANRQGDNAAQGGDVTYYMVASAAQKTQRTVN